MHLLCLLHLHTINENERHIKKAGDGKSKVRTVTVCVLQHNASFHGYRLPLLSPDVADVAATMFAYAPLQTSLTHCNINSMHADAGWRAYVCRAIDIHVNLLCCRKEGAVHGKRGGLAFGGILDNAILMSSQIHLLLPPSYIVFKRTKTVSNI